MSWNGFYFQKSILYSSFDVFFFPLNMHVKELFNYTSIHIIFIILLTTFNPPLKPWYHNITSLIQVTNEKMKQNWTFKCD
jgi:ABC-type polysaccharide/polyol phosphate export permease